MKVGVIMMDKVMFESILAGGILKFGKVDSADMSLIVKDIDKVFEVELDKESMDKYVVISNGDILLSDKYMDKVYANINSRKLEELSVGMLERYFANLDMMNFVLRKVNFLGEGNIPKDDLIYNFSVVQLCELKNLYNEGYVEDYMQEDCMYGNYCAIRVSKLGLVKLFMDDNQKDIDNFYKNILVNDLDVQFIQDYLMNINLEDDLNSILDVDKYLVYVDTVKTDFVYSENRNDIDNNRIEYCRKLVKGE